ncbi:MAG: SDR family oxidoreductase [Spirochaetaceae bacterium]|nr:MAG: SDR family oxidoreductase [Spirochaetaceae bacterium]
MKILLTGGTGNLSYAVTELAASRGFRVSVLNRGLNRSRPLPDGVRVLGADLGDRSAVKAVVADEHFDAVIQFRAFTAADVENDIAIFGDRINQYILISSASVYQKPPVHYRITESTPLDNQFWEYSRGKIACEYRAMQAYQDQRFPVTIVRPSYTYDCTWIPAAVGGRDYTVTNRMRHGKPIIVHGDGQSLWTMTHASDFAVGLLGLVGNQQALGESFHITSDEVLTWDQIYQAIGDAAGVRPRLVHIASERIGRLAPDWLAFLLGDKACTMVFDNSKIKRAVPEFRARVSFAAGVRRSMAWFDEDESRKQVNREVDAMIDRIIAADRLTVSEPG